MGFWLHGLESSGRGRESKGASQCRHSLHIPASLSGIPENPHVMGKRAKEVYTASGSWGEGEARGMGGKSANREKKTGWKTSGGYTEEDWGE